MLIGGPLGEGSNAGSTNSELWGAEHIIPRNEWTFRRSEGSGILIGKPSYREGSNAGSTLAVVTRMTEDPGGSAETSEGTHVQTISKAVREYRTCLKSS